jgi:hypothetical protein
MGFFNKSKRANEKYGIQDTFSKPEDMSDTARRWVTVSRQITAPLAEDWFEDLDLISIIDDILPRTVNESLFHLITPFGDKENNDSKLVKRVIPNLLIEESEFGAPLKITDTNLGKSVISVLESLGVVWKFEMQAYRTDNSEEVEIENPNKILAIWRSAFQLPIFQSFEVFERNGEEVGYWSAAQLLSTRAVEQIATMEMSSDGAEIFTALSGEPDLKTGDLTFGEWSTKMYIPILAQSLFYLAETPFPSELFSRTRSTLAFEDMDNGALPHPRLRMRRDQFVLGSTNNHDKLSEVNGALYPIVIDFGWEFTNVNISNIETLLPIFSNGLVAISTYLEDGFLNHVDPDDGFSWDWSMLSSCVTNSEYEEGKTHYGYGFWIPATFAGAVAATCEELHEQLDIESGEKHRSLTEILALDGVGYSAVCAINTFVFSYLRENLDESEWFCDFLLDQAVRLNIHNESTNALSNWGIVKFEVGNFEEAQKKFELALERDDKFAEAEASYYLAKIHSANGNNELAELFHSKCQEAGGYE